MNRESKPRGPLGRLVDRVLLGPEEGRDGPDPDLPRGGERWRYTDNDHENDNPEEER